MIKHKSLVVALISSFIICAVLVLTLVGYVMYMELKQEESKRAYQDQLQKINARIYAKYIEFPRLEARVETKGALAGKPVVEGIVKNAGNKDIADMLLKVKFLDKDGAIIYEIIFHPQEPALGSSVIPPISLAHLSGGPRTVIKAGGDLPFKKILTNCPVELFIELRDGKGFAKGEDRWSGKFNYEIVAIGF